MKVPALPTTGLAVLAGIALSTTAFAVVTIDWVTVGDPGNAAQSAANRDHESSGGDGYGAVAYTFRIARNETTLTQYTTFLNSVATTDTYGLWDSRMEDAIVAGITRSGSSGSYSYAVSGSGDRPIAYASWFNAARFANWLHNGQGMGDTETGAYTLNGATNGMAPARNVGATVCIPTESEWFKAAYYDPRKYSGAGGYWLHANQSDTMASNTFTVAGAANFYTGIHAAYVNESMSSFLSEVGAYGTDSQSYYGTNDQAGNLWELTDLDGELSGLRVLRGGGWNSPESILRSSLRSGDFGTGYGEYDVGFRFASLEIVPEPSAILMTLLAGSASITRRRRSHL